MEREPVTRSPIHGATNGRVEPWRIVPWASLFLIGAIYMMSPLELLSPSTVPIRYPVSNGAGSFIEVRTNEVRVPRDASVTSNKEFTQLFGLEAESVTEGALTDKWRIMEARITRDLEVVAHCQAHESCPSPAQKLIGLSMEGANRTGRARVGLINRAVDLAIRPRSDEAQWGVPDHWSDPFETLYSNAGDCEDYAIVKYAALLAAGLSKDAVKIVLIGNRLPNEDHAVVAAWVDDEWLILDNRTLTLVRDTDVTRAIPKFVLDHHGVRRFVEKGHYPKAAGTALRLADASGASQMIEAISN